jgi:hypothetical protein
MNKTKKPILLDQYIQIEEASLEQPSGLKLTIDFKAPAERRSQAVNLARSVNHGDIIERHFLLFSLMSNQRSYDAIDGPWVAHIKEVYKSFFTLKMHPKLEKKLNYLEILIDAMVEEQFISHDKAKSLKEQINKMALIPRRNIDLSLVSAEKDTSKYPLEPIMYCNNSDSQLIPDFNQHYKSLVSIFPQNNRGYEERNNKSKSEDMMHHYICLREINDKLTNEYNLHKKAIAMITPQKSHKFSARNNNRFFENKTMALTYHQACLREIETTHNQFLKIKI